MLIKNIQAWQRDNEALIKLLLYKVSQILKSATYYKVNFYL